MSNKSVIYFYNAPDYGVTFHGPQALSDPSHSTANNSQAASSSDYYQNQTAVYAVWEDTNTKNSNNSQIFFVKGDGASNNTVFFFNTAINLSNNYYPSDGSARHPQIDAAGNNVYVVWEEDNSTGKKVYFSHSSDYGSSTATSTSFGMPKILSGNLVASHDPKISISGNNVYVVWEDNSTGKQKVYFSHSSDNGTTFTSPLDLSINATDAKNAHLSAPVNNGRISGNNVYVVWEDNSTGKQKIYFKGSNTTGESFGPTVNLSNSTTGNSTNPQIATAGNNVYVVGEDNSKGKWDTYFVAGNTSSFSKPISITSDNTGDSINPQLSALGRYVDIVWENGGDGKWTIMFNRSNNFGMSFLASPGLSLSVQDDFHKPTILLGNTTSACGEAYVLWKQLSSPSNGEENDVVYIRGEERPPSSERK
jgi:hypothetical protein